jgi:hypothetical protein
MGNLCSTNKITLEIYDYGGSVFAVYCLPVVPLSLLVSQYRRNIRYAALCVCVGKRERGHNAAEERTSIKEPNLCLPRLSYLFVNNNLCGSSFPFSLWAESIFGKPLAYFGSLGNNMFRFNFHGETCRNNESIPDWTNNSKIDTIK